MTLASAPLGGHLVHVVPLLVPVLAVLGVFGPDAVRALVRRSRWLLLAAVSSVAAAVVHLVVIPSHFAESTLFGVFFVALAMAQIAYAGVLLMRPRVFLLVAGALGNIMTIGLWLVSRTVGLPLGPEAGHPEPVGALDILATTAELVLIGAVVLALRQAIAVQPSSTQVSAGSSTPVGSSSPANSARVGPPASASAARTIAAAVHEDRSAGQLTALS